MLEDIFARWKQDLVPGHPEPWKAITEHVLYRSAADRGTAMEIDRADFVVPIEQAKAKTEAVAGFFDVDIDDDDDDAKAKGEELMSIDGGGDHG